MSETAEGEGVEADGETPDSNIKNPEQSYKTAGANLFSADFPMPFRGD